MRALPKKRLATWVDECGNGSDSDRPRYTQKQRTVLNGDA
jgi:hypothetical protein